MGKLSIAARAVLRRRQVGYVFQQYNLVPHLTSRRTSCCRSGLRAPATRRPRRARLSFCTRFGLADKASAFPSTLSGGEQQRVAIGRGLANRPALLLADEPTGALDSEASQSVIALLGAQHDMGQTIVMVTHDPTVAAVADRTVHLLDGRVVREEALVP